MRLRKPHKVKKTCFYRLIRRCEDCTEDYDESHHPNNYDCPFYKEVIIEYNFEEPRKLEKII